MLHLGSSVNSTVFVAAITGLFLFQALLIILLPTSDHECCKRGGNFRLNHHHHCLKWKELSIVLQCCVQVFQSVGLTTLEL